MRTVHVVSFCPATEFDGFGGFNWYEDLAAADECYQREARDSAASGGDNVVRLVRMQVPQHLSGDEVTEDIDSRLDELEGHLPALRQYVPATTDADRVPTGKVLR